MMNNFLLDTYCLNNRQKEHIPLWLIGEKYYNCEDFFSLFKIFKKRI